MGLATIAGQVLVAAGLDEVVVWYRKVRGQSVDHLRGDRRRRFSTIYESAWWAFGDRNQESLSGNGSALEATSTVRRDLPTILTGLNAKNLLDVGCGDFNWMKEVVLPCAYVGVDIVPSVIEANRARHSSDRRDFLCLDAVDDELPKADVVLCREVLFHLSFSDARNLLSNIYATGARYLLATSEPRVSNNRDVPSGDFREINLAFKPYDLGNPINHIVDGDGPSPGRILGVWKL
jgi:SAM-dependent methyltransferase